MSAKRLIDLDALREIGLIILHPSGVLYTNQVGGHGCFHPEAEGVFFPLPVSPYGRELGALSEHFKGSWEALNEFEADMVDSVLRKSSVDLSWISVDRSRLKDSFEAWVYVNLSPRKTGMRERLQGFDDSRGVLTWPNSD
jgi:hypothetical protein